MEKAKQGIIDKSIRFTTAQGQELVAVTFENFRDMYLHDIRPSKKTLKLMLDEDYGVTKYINPSNNSSITNPYQILLCGLLCENNKINSNKGENSIEIKNKVSEMCKK